MKCLTLIRTANNAADMEKDSTIEELLQHTLIKLENEGLPQLELLALKQWHQEYVEKGVIDDNMTVVTVHKDTVLSDDVLKALNSSATFVVLACYHTVDWLDECTDFIKLDFTDTNAQVEMEELVEETLASVLTLPDPVLNNEFNPYLLMLDKLVKDTKNEEFPDLDFFKHLALLSEKTVSKHAEEHVPNGEVLLNRLAKIAKDYPNITESRLGRELYADAIKQAFEEVVDYLIKMYD